MAFMYAYTLDLIAVSGWKIIEEIEIERERCHGLLIDLDP
jgi:hypothetical protein